MAQESPPRTRRAGPGRRVNGRGLRWGAPGGSGGMSAWGEENCHGEEHQGGPRTSPVFADASGVAVGGARQGSSEGASLAEDDDEDEDEDEEEDGDESTSELFWGGTSERTFYFWSDKSDPEEEYAEYEDVLTSFEKAMLDRTDAVLTPMFAFCCRPREGHGFRWWEGMRHDVPERYQRWEGIRERNAVLCVVFALLGYGRQQPLISERIALMMLYLGLFYFLSGSTLSLGSERCQEVWKQECWNTRIFVPTNDDNRSILDPDFIPLEDGDAFHRFSDARCIDQNSSVSPCDFPLCAEGRACWTSDTGADGFCKCREQVHIAIVNTLLFSILFKLVFIPIRCVFWQDLWYFSFVVQFLVWGLVVFCFIGGAAFQIREGHDWSMTLGWIIKFIQMGCLEAVKAFFLGFVVGTYVIGALCRARLGRLWKFCLA